ncbi:MAG: hypothetical protein CMN55_02935 [Sneathiella sp.]|mgnify:FL=1|jgi:chemotaxis protein MotB|uniref:peptidoglycan -binding protein n=1 Tax=Sneathiella sp. TaxID=1964365 RepID=UPI000C4C5CDB|nr:peptidoglycan -binding protein [Sneathiella sp.]MAL78061.1 hypothetical protein [Sneathiella sp.]
MARRRRGQRAPYEIWPGFVDALTTLLLVIIFLLVVFALAQFFLSQALSGRDAALEKLNQQVNELADLLAIERKTSADLENQITQLNLDMTKVQEERDSVIIQLDTLTSRALSAEEDRDRLQVLLREAEEKSAEQEEKLSVSEDSLKASLAELERLKRDIAALEETRKTLEEEVGTLALTIAERDVEIGNLRDRSKELESRLAEQEERTNLAQKDIEERETRLAELQTLYLQTQDKLTEEEELSAAATAQVTALNAQINALRAELAKLNQLLDASEARDIEQKAQIADLGKRLNQALAAKVQELQQYRSEFFGKLREVLKNRPGISIVGDRFVFQSEVLFDAGSAELGPAGREDMAKFAATLREISQDIPDDIDWILRVDGHTDKQPINTLRFPSNWELSTARAVSVTKFLISQGIPPSRLAATGFGEFQPIDPRDDEIGYLRNRRIELKLTER